GDRPDAASSGGCSTGARSRTSIPRRAEGRSLRHSRRSWCPGFFSSGISPGQRRNDGRTRCHGSSIRSRGGMELSRVACVTIGGMATHPPDYHVVHPLPSAPQFVGRRAELDELLAWWYSGLSGVVALVGLGGAGKTAVAARLVAELSRPENPYRPAGLF